jgi:hypothetical protein
VRVKSLLAVARSGGLSIAAKGTGKEDDSRRSIVSPDCGLFRAGRVRCQQTQPKSGYSTVVTRHTATTYSDYDNFDGKLTDKS